MATSGIHDGSKLRLLVDDGAGGAKRAIGYATTMNIDLSAEEVNITHKDNAGGGVWQESKPKTLSGSISFEAYWAQTVIGSSTALYKTLFEFFSGRTKVAFSVSSAETGDDEYIGEGYITGLSGTATDKEEATFSGTLTVSGAVSVQSIV